MAQSSFYAGEITTPDTPPAAPSSFYHQLLADADYVSSFNTRVGAVVPVVGDYAAFYQPLDADLTSWAAITRASGFDTFATTPSSANLAALLTDKTGTGADVFAVSPALTGSPTAPTPSTGNSSTLLATTAFVATATREKLTANRIYYVRTDGSDSNTGLANTSGAAWLTLNKAATVISGLDLNTFSITVNVADGTYTGGLAFTGPLVGKGNISFVGNTTTPANVVISTTSLNALSVSGVAKGNIVTITGFKVQTTTFGAGLYIDQGSNVQWGVMDFGVCVGAHVDVRTGATATNNSSNYNITGNAAYHWLVRDPGTTFICDNNTVTLTGTPAFTNQFANVLTGAYCECASKTFSGSATGARYSAILNAIINTGGAGASYLPGDSAGSASLGGQYI